MLTCDFNLCIYQESGKCTLDSIDMNSLGLCDCAITVDMPEKSLTLQKKKQLRAMDNLDGR